VTDDDISKERDFIRSLASGRVDGVIMSVSGESTDHSYLESINYDHLPIVLFDRIYDDINLPKIVTDDYVSSFMATEHLIQSGCQRIAYFVINKELSIGKTRLQGYEDALKKYKIPLRKRLIVDCSNSYEENNEIIETAILKQKPDGILASVERLAFSTYYVCQRIGVKIPEDIKIIAFSSLEIAGLLNPPLSVVRQPAIQIGERAAATLLKQLTGETLQENEKFVTMHSDLVIKDSSRG
jgi:LacI family transcriptional regulator